jgi:hypothetical protein
MASDEGDVPVELEVVDIPAGGRRSWVATSFRRRPGLAEYALTEQEAFLAMELFIAQFLSTMGRLDEVAWVTLLSDIQVWADGQTHDPAAWYDWLTCVQTVKGIDTAGSTTWRLMGPPMRKTVE